MSCEKKFSWSDFVTRRDALAMSGRVAGGAVLLLLLDRLGGISRAIAETDQLIVRRVPRTGEPIPVIGLGTAGVFDVDGDAAKRAELTQVLQILINGGGKVVDTASTYGSSEPVLGDLLAQTGLRPKAFVATKLESYELTERGIRGCLERLHTKQIDLMQLHNVANPRQSLAPFRAWKDQGLCRYIGITSTYHNDYPAVEAVLRREKPDFLQIDYAIDNREAEKRILPACADLGVAVLTALPLGHGRLLQAVRGRPLPDWAREFDAYSWPQFFLKWVLGNPTITAVIPGTGNPKHMADNLGAGRGRLPDQKERERMAQFVASLS